MRIPRPEVRLERQRGGKKSPMSLEYWLHNAATTDRIIKVSRVTRRSLKLRLKRIVDVVGALTGLVVFLPTFLIAAVLIKLTSRGPVFYVRENLGLKRRPFMMLKFRTMTAAADQQEAALRDVKGAAGPFFKIQNDPRVTSVGRFLRKYSIDELPQLVNVLKGDMSLVGPRPIFDFEFEGFNEWRHLRRFSMKPGLTCIWQVSGRSNTSDVDRMRYDLEYVDNWSFLLDVKIFLKTIPVVLKGDGAV